MKTEYECLYCKRTHKFSPYVFAHWDIDLIHKCECGAINTLLQGEMTQHQEPEKNAPPHPERETGA